MNSRRYIAKKNNEIKKRRRERRGVQKSRRSEKEMSHKEKKTVCGKPKSLSLDPGMLEAKGDYPNLLLITSVSRN